MLHDLHFLRKLLTAEIRELADATRRQARHWYVAATVDLDLEQVRHRFVVLLWWGRGSPYAARWHEAH